LEAFTLDDIMSSPDDDAQQKKVTDADTNPAGWQDDVSKY
jgi:hypothetical protein